MKQARNLSGVLATLSYRAAVAGLVPLASLFLRAPAVRKAHRGRLAAPARLREWAHAHRDVARPLVWFHAASVGEGLQARAVLSELRRIRPDFQAVFTHFSASADRLESSMPADWSGYLPYDRQGDVIEALEAIQPTLLVFSKLDVWPELATQARARDCRVALVAGSVDPGSARLGRIASAVARRGYRAIEVAAAISEADGERLVQLGVDPERVVATGDPRIDSVLDLIDDARRSGDVAPDSSLLVAGSTWPVDEQMLLPALVEVRKSRPDAKLLLVPHEPSAERVSEIIARARGLGLDTAIWTEGSSITAPVTVVDRLGVLAQLYRLGGFAYVGGGFGTRGIHSVLEPAGWGRAVIIGPNDRGVRDARLLADAGGLIRLANTASVEPLVARWSLWLERPADARRAGEQAGAALAGDRGAAARSARLLSDLG